MFLTPRDQQIVHAVDDFGQLSAGVVRELFFKGLSNTPADRALLRLTKRKYLARIERPLIGGGGGGSGQYFYQLGSVGWRMCRGEGRYWPRRAVDAHMYAIAKAYVAIKGLEDTGYFKITRYRTEPKNWVTLAGVELRPDLYVEITNLRSGQVYTCWLEVDMGTERKPQLKEKMARYYHAWLHRKEGEYDQWPIVVFLVPDVDRKQELQRLIRQGTEEARALFEVRLSSDFPPADLSMQ